MPSTRAHVHNYAPPVKQLSGADLLRLARKAQDRGSIRGGGDAALVQVHHLGALQDELALLILLVLLMRHHLCNRIKILRSAGSKVQLLRPQGNSIRRAATLPISITSCSKEPEHVRY